MKKKLLALILAGTISVFSLMGCDAKKASSSKVVGAESTSVTSQGKNLKYIFLFIGDGMSYPQIQLTNYYLNTSQNNDKEKVSVEGKEKEVLKSENSLTMMNFPVSGSAQTYDSTSFAPDSASTATSIATGNKTWSGSINVSTDFSEKYKTIAEDLKAEKDYKIGIVSSVNINHATPAAFYAHQKSRNNYYDIGVEMINSNFDYFAGGALKKPTGDKKDKKDLYELAKENGYKVVKTQEEAEKLNADDGKSIVIGETLADSDSLSYDLDRKNGEWGLSDYVEKGIETLNNDIGFFMMVEGGKIDWACHANDAASTIKDTAALDKSVQKAVDFYNEHPDETLIIVTGDHETGGLTIGYAGTDYDTFLNNFNNQKISYAKFDSDYVKNYKKNKTSFEDIMKDVERLFGLKAPNSTQASVIQKDSADSHPMSEDKGSLVLTDYEYEKLKDAYNTTMTRTGEEKNFNQDEYTKYGSYEPLTVTITHILNNKSGINFGSYAHTGLPVDVLVKGVGEENFKGYYDNTEIYKRLADLTGIK